VPENLIPQSERTKSEQRKIAKQGGIASGKARREKKLMRETLDMFLSMPLKNGKFADVDDIRSFAALKGKNISVQEAIVIAQIQKAMKGDTRAAEYVRDTIGQKPVDSVKMSMNLPVMFEGEDDLEE
jgi:hypothetical protein